MKQTSLFDGAQKFVLDKPIRLIELFAGYGSQALSLKYLGANFEHWKISEWAIKSIQAYKDLHFGVDHNDYSNGMGDKELGDELERKCISSDYKKPLTRQQIDRLSTETKRKIYNNMVASHNLGSVTGVHGKDLEIVDKDKYCYVMSYSFPCFPAGSLVITQDGYKDISKVCVGDYVLSHDNQYHKVLNVLDNGIKAMLKINAMGVDEIKCTPNHLFYVRSMKRVGHYRHRAFSEPYWKEAKDLQKNDYLGVAINQNSIIPEWEGIDYVWSDGRKTRHKNTISNIIGTKEFWWIVGRYIGDGWLRDAGIIICSGKHKAMDLEKHLKQVVHYTKVEERTVYKYHISDKEWHKFFSQFGQGAKNKHLTKMVFDLPCDLLESFIEGYLSADGHQNSNGHWQVLSVSRELIYGLGQCIAKVYHRPYSITKLNVSPTTIIEDRVVNQNTQYIIRWHKEKRKQDKAIFDNGYCWYPIYGIERVENDNVYDITVEDSHSFTVQNTIVHNCQAISNAGKKEGLKKDSGTTSSLLWEVERILSELAGGGEPNILLMENVPQLLQEKNVYDFADWCKFLEKLGYKNYYKVLNTKDFGIPQNRERVFMVSIFGDYDFDFPMPIRCEINQRNLQQPNESVSEKYFLSERQTKYALDYNHVCDDTKRGDIGDRVVNPEVAKTISCRGEADQRADITNFVVGENDKTYTINELREVLSLKEILQKNVPEKYYLKDKIVEYFVRHTEEQKSLGNGFKFEPIDVSRGGGATCQDN